MGEYVGELGGEECEWGRCGEVRRAVEVGRERVRDVGECGGVVVRALGLPDSEVVLRDGECKSSFESGLRCGWLHQFS